MKTQPGTIISGTMRYQDLIPALLEEISETPEYAQLMMLPFGPVPSYVYDEGDDSEWWRSEDAECLIDELFEIMNRYAPDGHYFGAHPGDGCDYGYWRFEE